MVLKIVALALVFAVASPQGHGHGHGYSSQHIMMHHGKHVPVHVKDHDKHGKMEHHYDFYAPPKYKYNYKIKDYYTGDEKSHHETRHGDTVKGTYSLHEPDGRKRVVHYTADKHTGFHASVKHEGHAKHIIPKKHKKYHSSNQGDHHQHEHRQYDVPDRVIGPHYDSLSHHKGIANLNSVPDHKGVSSYRGTHYDGIPHHDITPHRVGIPHHDGILYHDRILHRERIPHHDGFSHLDSHKYDVSHHSGVTRHKGISHDFSLLHHDSSPRYEDIPQHDDILLNADIPVIPI